MAIKLGGNTNITLTNTSFVGDVYPGKKSVPLFTAASNGTYYFEGDIQDSGTIAVSLNINSTPKEIWTYYDSVSHHVSYEFTLVTGDIVEIEVSGYGIGSNLTVTKYADEPKEIYVGEGIDSYEAMRGPCPEGFHVPYQSECATLVQYLSTLGLTVGDDIKTYLHFPSTGHVNRNGTIESKSYARFRCADDNGGDKGRFFGLATSAIYTSSSNGKVLGYSIRPFKDIPVVPDSGRTTIYAGTGNAGIYRNSTLGLISISGDGTNWITIADKNLGATQVWSSGDTVSGTNGGNFFQRGNNYGFPFSGQTISNTQVDASTYGPGNYYTSSTFITSGSSIFNDWSNPSNSNLRGATTGITKKGNVTEVYVGTTKVRPLTN